ncbi:MAG TPA: site-2 protease family protein [Ktedonobacterales bacterium]
MPGSFRLFRVAGIDIEVNISWLIILALLTSSLALQWFPDIADGYSPVAYWTLGLVAALALFASVLVHELAHSLVARSRGLPVKSITLFIFGGVSNLEREPRSAGVEFQMALVGPVASAIIGGIALGAWALVGSASPLVAAMLLYLGASNLLLAVFNMIPGFPLDGGRVLRSLIWKTTGSLRRATLWAARIGQGVAILLILVGVWLFFAVDLIDGLWFGFIGWFLLQASQAENTQVMMESLLKGVTVRQVMSPPPTVAQGDLSLQQLVDAYVLPYGIRSIPVMSGDTFIGLTTLEDIRRVPRERWADTPASAAMTPVDKLRMARDDESLSDALPRLVAGDVNQLPVVDAFGRLIGMLSRDAIIRYLEVRRGLGMESERQAAERLVAPGAPRAYGDERTPATS